MPTKKFSIIMPAYNAEKTIDDSLDSIYQFIDDVEIIVIDDGSTDQTRQICLSEKYAGIKYYFQINGGSSSARNTGLDLVNTDYVLFLDNDDILFNETIRVINRYLDHYPDVDCIVFGTTIDFIDQNLAIKEAFGEVNYTTIGESANIQRMFENDLFNYVWNKVYKTKHLKDIRFSVGNESGEDFLFNCSYFENDITILTIPEILHSYRRYLYSTAVSRYYPNLKLTTELKLKSLDSLLSKYRIGPMHETDALVLQDLEALVFQNVMYFSFSKSLKLNKDIFNPNYEKVVKRFKARNVNQIIFCFLYNINSVELLTLSYSLLNELRKLNKIKKLYRKLRYWG